MYGGGEKGGRGSNFSSLLRFEETCCITVTCFSDCALFFSRMFVDIARALFVLFNQASCCGRNVKDFNSGGCVDRESDGAQLFCYDINNNGYDTCEK